MRVSVSIMLAAVAVGCTRSFGTRAEPVDTTGSALDGARVTAIARHAVATNDTWIASAEFESPHREPNGSGVSVLVWRLPKTPGGHTLLLIDETGRVTAYIRGK